MPLDDQSFKSAMRAAEDTVLEHQAMARGAEQVIEFFRGVEPAHEELVLRTAYPISSLQEQLQGQRAYEGNLAGWQDAEPVSGYHDGADTAVFEPAHGTATVSPPHLSELDDAVSFDQPSPPKYQGDGLDGDVPTSDAGTLDRLAEEALDPPMQENQGADLSSIEERSWISDGEVERGDTPPVLDGDDVAATMGTGGRDEYLGLPAT